MQFFIPDVSASICKLPHTKLAFKPFLCGEAVNVGFGAVTCSLVVYIEKLFLSFVCRTGLGMGFGLFACTFFFGYLRWIVVRADFVYPFIKAINHHCIVGAQFMAMDKFFYPFSFSENPSGFSCLAVFRNVGLDWIR
ncbi:hypothetical protein ES703_87150 [subsurface metagenome]